jgi:Gluconate 2-dehydrogenase subunit 3
MPTRRELLKIAAAMPAAASAQHAHSSEPIVQIARPVVPKAFDKAQFQMLTRLVDLIIPRTETPGAADAGVDFQIDGTAAGKPELRAQLARGLAALDSLARKDRGHSFLELAAADQISLLEAVSGDANSETGRFFRMVKEMTIDGYYSTREGLEQELGWHGNTYLSSFPGCTHPEHQG